MFGTNNYDHSVNNISEEDFSFSSNQNYLDFKMNNKNRPIFCNPKFFTFFNENSLSENLEKDVSSSETQVSRNDKDINENNQISFPIKKKTFFDENNFEKKKNIEIRSFLFNFRKN